MHTRWSLSMELGENNKNKDWRKLQIQLSVLRETGRDFELLGLKILQMAWSQPVVSLFTVWYRGQNLELLWLMLVQQNFDCWMFHKDISIGSYLAAKAPGPKKYGPVSLPSLNNSISFSTLASRNVFICKGHSPTSKPVLSFENIQSVP